MATSSAELLQAQEKLWRHSFAYLKSMALYTAVKLGVPDALHRCGGTTSLLDLLATLSLPPNKLPYLPHLLKVLAAAGIFTAEDVPAAGQGGKATVCVYRLTPVYHLLMDDVAINGSECLSRFVLMVAGQFNVAASMWLHQWFRDKGEDVAKAAFTMVHGEDFYGVAGHDAEFNVVSNEGMGSDSQFTAELIVRECGEVFTWMTSLIDVGGGNSATTRAIAKVFPHVT